MKKEQPNVDSLEPNVDSLRSNVASLESKFKVGDKVVICSKPYDIKWDGIVKTIKSVELNEDGEFVYSFYDYNYNIVEDTFPHLSLYTEESRNLSQNIANCDKSEDKELTDNVEKEELNLCELLRGCEGERVLLSLSSWRREIYWF